MGIDWEELLGAEGEDLQDAYDANIPDDFFSSYPDEDEYDEQSEKAEYARGSFFDHDVVFKRVFATHRFTDEEVNKLLAGEIIEIAYQTKDGKEKSTSGRLQQKEGKHGKYFGFTPKFDERFKNDYSASDISA